MCKKKTLKILGVFFCAFSISYGPSPIKHRLFSWYSSFLSQYLASTHAAFGGFHDLSVVYVVFRFLYVPAFGVLFPRVCVIFLFIVFDLSRWQVHSPHDPRRQKTVGRPAASQVVFVFTCVYRVLLHSAGVQALCV